jgi:hypothetical protein
MAPKKTCKGIKSGEGGDHAAGPALPINILGNSRSVTDKMRKIYKFAVQLKNKIIAVIGGIEQWNR